MLLSLPACGRRSLERIDQTLLAEDPGLGARFAVFTRLTRHEAMPRTEQMPRRLQRFLRRAILLPLLAISLVAVLVATSLMPSQQACPAGQKAVAGMSPVSRAARCQPAGPGINLDTMPRH